MPSFFKAVIGLWALLLATGIYAAQQEEDKPQPQSNEKPAVVKAVSIAPHGTPLYPDDFRHFNYVNPDAPKGGQLVVGALGTFDNFNRNASRGDSVIGGLKPYQNFLHDTLMRDSDDEYGVLYPLIAESLEYPEDYTWVIFNINPKARFHDGKPITAHDVVFSFNKFLEQGVIQFRKHYENVASVEALSDHRVKFSFKGPNRNYVADLAASTVFAKHYWQDHDLSEPMDTPPLGSGPYRIGDFKMGQYVTYDRVKDYWAANLPVNKGRFNFDTVRFDYYLDISVAREAFKAGRLDIRQESEANQWKEAYDIPAVKRGDIIKAELENDSPITMSGLIFNNQHELFKNRKVRHALAYMLDFESLNKQLFYGDYKRVTSYFGNTPYDAEGKPEGLELEILNQFRDQLSDEYYGPVWQPNVTDGTGNVRSEMREALKLLKEAGWKLENNKLVHAETGKPFEFEMLIYTQTSERYILPFKRNLERIGIDMSVRLVDTTQYLSRIQNKDYDMTSLYFESMPYPSADMTIMWHSDHFEATWNYAAVKDPVIDALVEGIVANQQNEDKLLAYGRAFDRVALWNMYAIPKWYYGYYRVAYWNKFSRPQQLPKLDVGLDSWWYDAGKAKTIKQ